MVALCLLLYKMYVTICGKKIRRSPEQLRQAVNRKIFEEPFPANARYCCSWRGGGFRDNCKEFFQSMMGKFYRVPGFLATSLQRGKAMEFIRRADRSQPRILWCILVTSSTIQSWIHIVHIISNHIIYCFA